MRMIWKVKKLDDNWEVHVGTYPDDPIPRYIFKHTVCEDGCCIDVPCGNVPALHCIECGTKIPSELLEGLDGLNND